MNMKKGMKEKEEQIKKDEQSEELLEQTEENSQASDSSLNEELSLLKDKYDDKLKECEEYKNMLQRTAAEFDNFKKRTSKEKEAIYNDAVSDVIAAFLPVVDNIERAVEAALDQSDAESLKEGVNLIYRQFKEVMNKIDVTEIEGVGSKFDPNMHNAVMHVEDNSFEESTIIEEFQKGYMYKEKVIRHSMVKVAN
ncbi:UNVERIFIED_CONTAM: molecular chaperone GrpE [Acetivibrio alkalicellulosi]